MESQLELAHRAVEPAPARASTPPKASGVSTVKEKGQAIKARKRASGRKRFAHSAIVRSMGLIRVVATSLLLCSAQSLQPVPHAYRAKPKDVPLWAEQG